MSFKNILVHVDTSERCEEHINVACDLALRTDAHVSGLFVIPEPFYPLYTDGGYIPQDLIQNQEAESKAQCEVAEKTFREATAKAGAHAEWRSEQGPLSTVVTRHARYADLTVVGKGDIDDPVKFPNPFLAADVAMSSGRPVLIVPNAGHFEGFGKHILVCWNTSREAVRAVNDALPLLQAAEKVTVLVVNPDKMASGDHGEIPSADIALHLARHGIKVEAASTTSDGTDVGDIILSRASDLGADMIVCGAYGHSRTREWILGGVTKTLVEETTIPVFMSH